MTNGKKTINPMRVLWLSLFATPLVGSSVDVFVPSLPYIANHFATSPQLTRMMVTVYLISYGIFQLFYGGLSDSFGRRKILSLACAGYTLAAIMIPFSPSIYVLLGWRFFHGICAAGIGVTVRALMTDCFNEKELAKKAAYITMAWTLGPIIAPYIGGYLQHALGWQAPFYFLAIYGLLTLLLIFTFLPETCNHFHSFNVKTIFTNYRAIVTHNGFLRCALMCGMAYGLITLYNVTGPFLVETALQYSPIVYGHLALLLGLAWLGGNFATRLMVTYSHKAMHTFNLLNLTIYLATAVLAVLFSYFDLFNLWTVSLPTLIIFICGGALFTFGFGKSLSLFPTMGASASAVTGSIYSFLAGVMSGIGSLLQTTTLMPLALTYLVLGLITCMLYRFMVWPMLGVQNHKS